MSKAKSVKMYLQSKTFQIIELRLLFDSLSNGSTFHWDTLCMTTLKQAIAFAVFHWKI